ncbi:putative glycoside hydrolase family 16 protein [Rosellinia necatrix]|uniref:Putative glycoside hydrolase family 16 protein n=1 Tax=Rosellinia necatrix TaxID=77044 RepID=A0A1S8A871_ROSNE|nr:putative glycoside hydrolase family 16 protein [Rosellinia necatrix]
MAYSLSTHYAGQGLIDGFNFFTGQDPTHGFVDYLSKEEAMTSNIVSIDEFNRVKLGVDSINTYSTSDRGRPSVRLTSNHHFTHGLFIADFAHMPSSTCGTWPTFWTFNSEGNGSFWPKGGEVDIIEGANTAQRNLFSAHT